MLEGVLERLIISLCGDYLADFNREQLKVSIWNGDVTLKALKLRSSALDSLNLPLHVVSGHIGTLSIKVPWARLTSQAVQIKVDGIYVCAQPLSAEQAAAQSLAAAQSESKTADGDDTDTALSLSERSAYAIKRRLLEEHRARVKSAKQDAANAQNASTYSERTVAKIIANLNVHVSNVHVRYEDSQSIPRQTFAVGLTIAAIKIFTIDAQGRPTFVVEESSDDKARKAVKVNMLSNKKVELTCGAFYWQCGAEVWANSADYATNMTVIERHSHQIENKDKAPLYPYILHPLDIGVKVLLHDDLNISVHEQQKRLNASKASDRESEQRKLDDLLSQARYDLSFTVNRLSLSVDQRQYTSAMQLADAFTAVRVQMELAALRARLPPSPSRSTAQWQRAYMRWAIQCVGDILHTDNNRRLRWSTIQRHGNDRRRYLQLYTRSLSSVLPNTSPLYSAVSGDEKTELKKLEIRLPLSSLIVYRTICEAKLSAQTEWIESKKKADEEAERRKVKATAKPFWSRLTTTAAVPVATIPAPHMPTASAAVAAPVAVSTHGTTAAAVPVTTSTAPATNGVTNGVEAVLAASAAGDSSQVKSAEERKRREEEQKRMLESITLSEEQQKLITEIDKALPPNFKTFRVEIELTEAVFLLTRPQANTNESSAASTPLMRMNWDGRCVLEQFTASSLADISVHSIECIDCVTPDTHFPLIVSSQSLLLSPTSAKPSLLTLHYQNELRSLFPLSPFDIATHMSLSPLSITLSPMFVSALIAYFHTPQDTSGYVSAVASAQMQSTTDTLLSALTDHRAYDIILTVKQPRIIVPEDSQSKDSRMLIAEWNDMSLTTRPDTSKSARDATIDPSMYDVFELSIRSMKLLICSSPKQWEIIRMEESYTTSPHLLYIIGGGYDDPYITDIAVDNTPSASSSSSSTPLHRQHQGFDVELILYTCTRNVATLSNVNEFPPLLMLDGRLPNLHFTLCGETYDTFMSIQSQLMRVIAPIIDDGSALPAVATSTDSTAVDTEMSMMKSARKLQLADEQLDTRQSETLPSSQTASDEPRNQVSHVRLHATRKLLTSHLVIQRVQVDVSTARSFPSSDASSPPSLTVTKPPPLQLFTVTFSDLSLAIDQSARDHSYLFLLESFELIDHFQPHSTNSPFAHLIACQSLPIFPRYDLRWQETHPELSKQDMDEAIKQSEAASIQVSSLAQASDSRAPTDLATSNGLIRASSSSRHLISFHYRLILKPTLFDAGDLVMSAIRHPRTNEFLPILHLLDLRANTLHIQWNPSTIAAVLRYVTETQASIVPPTTNGIRRQSQPSVTPTVASAVSGTDLPNLTALNAQLNAFTMTLNKEFEGRSLCRIEVVHLKVKHVHAIHPPLTVMSPSLSTFSSVGSLDNLRLIDLSTPKSVHQEIFGMKEQSESMQTSSSPSVVSFTFDTFLPTAAPVDDGRRLGSRMKVSISCIRIVAIQQVILELTDYLTEGIINVLLTQNTPQTPNAVVIAGDNHVAQVSNHSSVDVVGSASASSDNGEVALFSALDVELFDPVIVVPRHESSTECLTANLGQIKVSNSLVSDRMQYRIVCSGMELSSATERAVSSLLKMDVAVTAMTALAEGALRPRDYSDLMIAVDVDAVNGTLTDDALLLILQVQAENLSAPPILTITNPPDNASSSAALHPLSRPLSPLSASRNNNAVVFHYNDEQAPTTMDIKLKVKQAKLVFAYSQPPVQDSSESRGGSLARMTLNGIALSMNRYFDGNTQSEISLQSLSLNDIRTESLHSPFKKILCPFSQLNTLQADAVKSPTYASSPSSSSSVASLSSSISASAPSAEFEVTWQDTADGRRDVVITVRRPCGFVIIPFWLQFADFALSALNTATANAANRLDEWKALAATSQSRRGAVDHSDALARHLRAVADAHDRKAVYNSLPSEDKVALPFRSLTIAASSCRLLLLEDATNAKSRALVMSCDVAIHLSQTEPDERPYRGTETQSFLFASEDRDLQVNRLRVFVCRADQPVVSAAHSIISPFTIRLLTESKTHKRYATSSEESVFSVTAASPTIAESAPADTSSSADATMTVELEEHSDHVLVLDVASGSALEMRASYQDIKLVMTILNTMQAEQAAATTSNTQTTTTATSVTTVASVSTGWTSLSSESGFIPLRHSVSQTTASARVEWCELTVVLINDCHSRYVPLLLLRLMPATANALIKTKTESHADMIVAGTLAASAPTKPPTLVVSPPHSAQSVYTVSVSCLFEVTSFNDRVIAWEPLIEPTHLSVQLHTETDVNNEPPTHSATNRPHVDTPAATVNISARSAINLNLTYATIKNLIETFHSWSVDAANTANTAESYAPFIIANQTGGSIWYSITSLVEPSKSTNSATANNGASMLAAPSDFDVVTVSSTSSSLHKVDSNHSRARLNNETSIRRSNKRSVDDAAALLDDDEQTEYHVSSDGQTQLTIAQLQSAQHRHHRSRGLKTSLDDVFATILAARDPFALAVRAEGDWSCPERIMIGRVGMRTYKLTRQRTVADKVITDRQLLVVDVCQRDGCKFISIRSSTQLINRTHRPLLFCLHSSFDSLEKVKSGDDKQFALIGPIKPDAAASVPFHLSHYEFISVRPLSSDIEWEMFPRASATSTDEKDSEWQWTDGALDYEAVLKSVHASLMTTSAAGSLYGHGFCMIFSSYAATQMSSISSPPQRFLLHVTANNQRSDHLSAQRSAGQGEALLTLSLTFAVPLTLSNHLAVPATIDIAYATDTKHSIVDSRKLQPTQSTHFISLAMSRDPFFVLKVDGFLDSLPVAITLDDTTGAPASDTGEVSVIRNVRIEDRRQSSLIVHVAIRRIGPSGGGLFVQLYTTYVLVDRTGLNLVYGAGFQHDSGALSVHRVLPAYGRRIYAEVYENQRSNLLSWRPPFLPTDRPAWSNASGSIALAKETFPLPAHERTRRWMWTSEWRIDDGSNNATDVDRLGWQYAFDFPADWHGHSSVGYNVRRRRWIRTYAATRSAPESVVCCYTSQRRNDQVEEVRVKLSVSDGFNEWRRVIDAVGAPYVRRRRSDSRWSESFDPTAHSDGLITLIEIETVEVVSDAEMRHAINRWTESQPANTNAASHSVIPSSLSASAALPSVITLPPALITNAHSFTRHNHYDIAVAFSLLEDPLRHTRLISFSPRYIITNNTTEILYIRQAHRNRAGIMSVDPKSFAPVWWIDAGGGKDSGPTVAVASAYSASMYVAVDESPSLVPPKSKDNADALVSIAFPPANDASSRLRWRWSGAFSLKQAGSLTIACHSNNDATTRNVAINIVVSGASIVVSINNEDASNASYRIDNRTDCALFVRQELKADQSADSLKTVQSLHQRLITHQQQPTTNTSSSFHSWIPVVPSSPTCFAWSEPTAEKPHRLSIVLAIPQNGKASTSSLSVRPSFTYILCSAVALDDIGLIRINRDYSVYAEVFVDGATKVLSITRRSGTSITQRPRSASAAADAADGNKTVRVENAIERTSLLLIVAVPFLTVSLIDRHPLELALLTLQQIAITYTSSNIYEKCEVTVGDIQVDNQLPNAIYPVILYQSTHRHRGIGQQSGEHSLDTLMKQRPFIQLSAIKLTQYSSLVHFKYVGFIMQEIIIQIEQSFVAALVPFIDVTQPSSQQRSINAALERQTQTDEKRQCTMIDRLLSIVNVDQKDQVNGHDVPANDYRPSSSLSPSTRRALSLFAERIIKRIKSESSIGGRIIYLEQLVLQPIRCQFSFNSLPASVTDQKLQMVIERASSSASSSSVMSTRSTSSNDPSGFLSGESATFDGAPLSAEASRYLELLSYSALVFANAEDVRLKMAGLSINHVFATDAQLISLLSQHYVNTLTAQFLQLIGRSHALGNPLGLVSNLGSGVFDLFNEPATAFIKGPAEFGKGLAVGVGSLVKHSVYGVASSAGSLTATVGNALAALSVDDEWMRARKKQRSRQPKHAVSGLVQGGVELSKGIFDGVVGLVRSPIEGAMDSGVSGLALGVGRGLIGVVAKPVSGAFDMVSSIADGVKNTTTMFDETRRRKRQQRIIYGPDRLIRPYASKEISAQCFLTTTSALRIAGHQRETYIDHFAVETDEPRAFVVRHTQTSLKPTQQPANSDHPTSRRAIAYVLTDKSIICITVRISDRSCALIWSHYLTSIKSIRAHSPETNEITLVIDNDVFALIRLPNEDIVEHMANTIRNNHNRIQSQVQTHNPTSPNSSSI